MPASMAARARRDVPGHCVVPSRGLSLRLSCDFIARRSLRPVKQGHFVIERSAGEADCRGLEEVPRCARVRAVAEPADKLSVGHDDFVRPLGIAAFLETPGELHRDAEPADRGTLQSRDVLGLVEHPLDLVGTAATAFADAGLDRQQLGELEVGPIVAAEVEGGFNGLRRVVKSAAVGQRVGVYAL